MIELLRVPLTRQKTGELLLMNDVEDARCSFEQGKLVQCSLNDLRGEAALESVLSWEIGEFEFREAALPASLQQEKNLHKCLVAEIKRWYSSRIKNAVSVAGNTSEKVSFREKKSGPKLKLVESPVTAQETIRSIHFGDMPSSGLSSVVRASVDLQALALGAEQMQLWKPYKKAVLELIESEGKDAKALQFITLQNDLLFASADQMTHRLAKGTSEKAALMQIGEITVLLMSVFAALLTIFVSRRISLSILKLTEHADLISQGKSNTPIPIEGPGEVKTLAKSLERMRISLQKAMEMLRESDS